MKHGAVAVSLAAIRGTKSIDSIRNRYEPLWKQDDVPRPAHQADALLATAFAKDTVKAEARRLAAIRNKPAELGAFAAHTAMLRLVVSFRAATFTARQGMHFETCCLARTIVEQLAWTLAVRPVTDDSLFKRLPATCIAHLKPLFPEAGRFYGKLSEVGHINPTTTLRYLDFSEPADPGVILVTDRYFLEDARTLLTLCDMYTVVAESLFLDQVESPRYVRRGTDGTLEPAPDREVATYLNDFLARHPHRGAH